jgi:hypothetical protein
MAWSALVGRAAALGAKPLANASHRPADSLQQPRLGLLSGVRNRLPTPARPLSLPIAALHETTRTFTDTAMPGPVKGSPKPSMRRAN